MRLLALLSCLLLMTACSVAGGAADRSADDPRSVAFQVVDIEAPQLDDLRTQPPGAYWITVDDKPYLAVTAGEKPTAGYVVRIETVAYDGSALLVRARLQEPKPGDMVAQVITYPMAILSIQDESLHQLPATVEWITDANP